MSGNFAKNGIGFNKARAGLGLTVLRLHAVEVACGKALLVSIAREVPLREARL